MAQALTKADNVPAAGGMSTGDLIKSMVVAVLLGIGGGATFGYFAIPSTPALPAKEAPPTATSTAGVTDGRFPSDALEIAIPSIIVDLKGEPRSRVRLDLSIVAVHGTTRTGVLKDEVREDIIAFLKGLTVADIQGVRGFQNLREQLNDRAKIRGRGSILGVLIGGFVIE
ncbi:flagellar basal body-associated FliL family protein [Hyphomicrobium sp.]|jgi:flagellar FliL protein|uniref:flagellar basal body-associated FliL family protein n=1 Tax=Hyphomicrobium sp. TaxID=82 RepID=UPI002BACE185|nr:flagellar basal body-associated FliL family protein [Hyphomicrobium sp.]HVZ04385.1 flagellar basal body-associated FliL family protein [Hyphomicrobium sp.]